MKNEVDSIFTSKATNAGEISSPLPTSLNLGASFEMQKFIAGFPVPLNLAADVHIGLNDVPTNYSSALIGFGAELDLLNGWLPVRTGILLGGREKFLWTAGVGLHFWNSFDLDLATENMSMVTAPNSIKAVSAILAMKVRI
jgi:hypothetical protein